MTRLFFSKITKHRYRLAIATLHCNYAKGHRWVFNTQNCSSILLNIRTIYTWTLQGVPNWWSSVPLSNPLGFKHNPLEGAGIYIYTRHISKIYYHYKVFFVNYQPTDLCRRLSWSVIDCEHCPARRGPNTRDLKMGERKQRCSKRKGLSVPVGLEM